MRKMFRKIAALIFVAMLVIAPSSSALASTTSQPVLFYSDSGAGWAMRTWLYQPEPLDVLPSQTVKLFDTTTGQPSFYVPAGQELSFVAYTPRGSFHCQVFRLGNNTSELVYSMNGPFTSFGMDFQPVDYPCAYVIQLTSTNSPSYPNSQISYYQVAWYY
jgi:hypothetical protein